MILKLDMLLYHGPTAVVDFATIDKTFLIAKPMRKVLSILTRQNKGFRAKQTSKTPAF